MLLPLKVLLIIVIPLELTTPAPKIAEMLPLTVLLTNVKVPLLEIPPARSALLRLRCNAVCRRYAGVSKIFVAQRVHSNQGPCRR